MLGSIPKNSNIYKSSFENKNISKDFLLQDSFNFKFAGNCNIFISKSRKHYNVCRIGYSNVNGLIMFNHDEISRIPFNNLYNAVQYFIYEVSLICQSMDWYQPDLFDPDEFYEFANKRLFN